MKLLILSVVLCGLAGVQGVEICRALYPGAGCHNSCPENFIEVYRNFAYCYSGKLCCKVKPTTPTTTTTTTTTTKPEAPRHKQCGINAIAVSGRIVKDDPQSYRFSEMECAWPWVISLYTDLNNGPIVKSCNGVLLSKNKFLSVKTCFEVAGTPINESIGTIKAHVGSCNVTGVENLELLTINSQQAFGDSDLVVVEFSSQISTAWNLNLLPVCLPDENTEFRDDENSCVIASRSKDQGIVLSSRVSVIPKIACDNIRNKHVPNLQPEGTFCTSVHGGFSVDEFDHGGVVMCPDQNNHWILKGVINKGRKDTGKATDEIIDIEPIGSDLISNVFGP